MTRRIFCKVLLVVVAVFGLLVLSGVLLAQGRSEDAFDHVKYVQERNTDRLLAMDGVEGTAIGFNQNDQLAIKVFTAGPGVRGIPQELDGVPVQVVVTGKIYALADPTAKFDRPVPIGVSTGHPNITAGTIGCRVKDDNGNVYALSNNHVYADENQASTGDNVLQPGTYDGGVEPDDAIGTLFDFEPIVFHPRANNTIDAAIALSDTDNLGNATPSDDGYGTPSSDIFEGDLLNLAVQKYGRTTGLTTGQVTGINATVRVRYSSGSARFVGQIIIEPGGFSDGGDSGSLIVTLESNNPVGLLFAGNSTVTIANPIDLVLERFGVTVDGEEASEPVNNPPIADFSFTTSDLIAYFTDLSTDSDSSVLTWNWDFGDGSTSTVQNPTHSYAASGTYTVKLTVTDDDDASGSASISITVGTSTPPSGIMNVESIDIVLDTRTAGRNTFTRALATVTILDASNNPVEGATVYGSWSGATSDSDSGVTNSSGEVTLESDAVKNAPGGTEFIFTVDDVVKSGWTYTP